MKMKRERRGEEEERPDKRKVERRRKGARKERKEGKKGKTKMEDERRRSQQLPRATEGRSKLKTRRACQVRDLCWGPGLEPDFYSTATFQGALDSNSKLKNPTSGR